jgi:hypothetical protein
VICVGARQHRADELLEWDLLDQLSLSLHLSLRVQVFKISALDQVLNRTKEVANSLVDPLDRSVFLGLVAQEIVEVLGEQPQAARQLKISKNK